MIKRINNFHLIGIYCILALLFYHQSLTVYFLSDDFTQLLALENLGIGGITKNYNIAFLRPLPYFIYAILHSVFGIVSALPYHLFNILLHAINGFLVFKLISTLQEIYSTNNNSNKYIAFIAGVLFIALPYQTEAVTWVAGIVDVMVGTFTLLTLYYYFLFKNTRTKKTHLLSVGFFFLALMCKEACLFIPFFIFGAECIIDFNFKNIAQKFKTTLVYLIWLPLYFALRYYFLGDFIGGYHSQHTSVDAILIIKNAGLYIAKFFALYRLIPVYIKDILKTIIHSPLLIAISSLSIIVFVFLLRNKLRNIINLKLHTLLFFGFLISLLPVINLETSFIGDSQSDRYGYIPSVFFILILTFVLNSLSTKWLSYSFAVVLSVFFYFKIQEINANWISGSTIVKDVINDFKANDKKNYILNLPDNINGTYILRCGFIDALTLAKKKSEIEIVSYHAIQSKNDSVKIEKKENGTFKISLENSQNKFYGTNIFFDKKRSDNYIISSYNGNSYNITFNTIDSSCVYWYSSKGRLIQYQ